MRVMMIVLVFVLIFTGCSVQEEVSLELDLDLDEPIKMAVLFDYVSYEESYARGDGFSILVEWKGKNGLFDTPYRDMRDDEGKTGFTRNMEKLNVDPKELDFVFLSHDHATNGLTDVVKLNEGVKIYKTFDTMTSSQELAYGIQPVVVDGLTEIEEGIWSTGALEGSAYGGVIYEQLMVLETEQGLIVFTGCAHPGIDQMLMTINEQFPEEPILMMIGGFHLKLEQDEAVFRKWLDLMHDKGVKSIIPIHCSGDEFKFFSLSNEKIKVYEGGAGMTIRLK